MKKYFLFVIGLVAIIAIILVNNDKSDAVNNVISDQITNDGATQDSNLNVQDTRDIDQLKSQLRIALESGGITSEAYDEINKQINYFESRNYDQR